MKKLTLFLLMLIPTMGISQAKIGFNPSQIREEFPNVEWNYQKWGENKDKLSMAFMNDEFLVNYLFDENNVSIITAIAPFKQGTLQAMIELYNSKYVIINKNTWRFYDNGVVFICRLKAFDDGSFYFKWQEDK